MRMVITAGPTREYFDTVRFVSNPSTGKMGYALARAARSRGHDLTLISGPVTLEPLCGIKLVRVVSAAEMFRASCKAFDSCDAAVMTAAVCDYRPARRLDHKLQKRSQPRSITLVPTRDIAAHLGAVKAKRVVIGFAMEDHDHRRHAEAKLRRKQCDAIVLNGPGNVGSDEATVEILEAGRGWSGAMSGSKGDIAEQIVKLVERLVAAK